MKRTKIKDICIFVAVANIFAMAELYEYMLMTDERIIELLGECMLFKDLNSHEIASILEGNLGRTKQYKEGTLIAQAGEEVAFLHIILRGVIKGEMVDYAGKVIKIEDITPVRPLAPAFLFGRQNRYPVNISSGDDALLLSIPRDHFLNMLQQSEHVLVNFINIVSSRGQFLSNKIKFLSFNTIKGKLAQYLLDLSAQTDSMSFTLAHSQSQLSELFGVARPSIGRAVSELNRDGIIRTEGKSIEILNLPGLTSFLS